MNNEKESKAMLEVWEWKEKAAKTVEHLSAPEAVHKQLMDLLEFEKQFKADHPQRRKR